MSEEDVQRMQQTFDAFSRRDKASFDELCDPNIEVIPAGDWPESEIRGRDAVWDFLITTDEPWEPGVYELSEIDEHDEHVVAHQRRDLRGKSSGVEVAYDFWIVFSFRDGRVHRAEWFSSRAEALEAAGISD